MALNADDILNADDTVTREVEVPEWRGTVLVKALTGRERDRWEASITKISRSGNRIPDPINSRAKLVVMALVNEHGERLFADSDAPKLAGKSARAVERLFDVISEISGLGDDAVAEIQANLDTAQSGSSTSSSPSDSESEPSLNY